MGTLTLDLQNISSFLRNDFQKDNRCPDLLTGDNCTISWHEEYSPFTDIVICSLILYNSLLLIFTSYILRKNWTNFRKDFNNGEYWLVTWLRRRKMKASAFKTVEEMQHSHRERTLKLKGKFYRELNIFILLTSVLQELAHIAFFVLHQGMEFTFDPDEEEDPRRRNLGYASCVMYTLAVSFAFAANVGIMVLFQKMVSSPLVPSRETFGIANLLSKGPFNLFAANSIGDLKWLLLPWLMAMVALWICLSVGVFQSPIEFLRVFVAVTVVFYMVQGMNLALTGRSLIGVIGKLVESLESSRLQSSIDCAQTYKNLLSKLKLFVIGCSVIQLTLSFGNFSVVAMGLFHDPLTFFICMILYNISFAALGTFTVIFLKSRKRAYTGGNATTTTTANLRPTNAEGIEGSGGVAKMIPKV